MVAKQKGTVMTSTLQLARPAKSRRRRKSTFDKDQSGWLCNSQPVGKQTAERFADQTAGRLARHADWYGPRKIVRQGDRFARLTEVHLPGANLPYAIDPTAARRLQSLVTKL